MGAPGHSPVSTSGLQERGLHMCSADASSGPQTRTARTVPNGPPHQSQYKAFEKDRYSTGGIGRWCEGVESGSVGLDVVV